MSEAVERFCLSHRFFLSSPRACEATRAPLSHLTSSQSAAIQLGFNMHNLPTLHFVAWCCLVGTATPLLCPTAMAQTRAQPNVHYFLNANQAPGAVAAAQVARGARGIGTFQAVSLSGPPELKIALARDGQFLEPLDAPVTTGMLVAGVYRFRVTNIPFRPGEELYPSLEVIDRIYPPAGREHRFPIPVVLTEEDLRLALDGGLVTRVIYLEDSELAEPIDTTAETQIVHTVPSYDNALQVADQLGKPVAILRIGSRVPLDPNGDLSEFLYGCPPWVPLITAPNRQTLVEAGQWPETLPSQATDKPRSEPPLEDSPRLPR